MEWNQVYLQPTAQWVHCILCIKVTCITAAFLITVTSYFAYLWHNFVLNVAPLPLASCFHFVYLKSQAFQSKDSFTFCLYSVLHNCPSALAVCKTLQVMNKIIIQQRVSEKKKCIYLHCSVRLGNRKKKKKKTDRLTVSLSLLIIDPWEGGDRKCLY